MNRHQGGRTGGPPVGAVSGDSTSGDQAVDVRMGGQGTGPGVPHPQHPHQTAPIMRVRRTCEERVGRGPDQAIVEVLLLLTAALPTRVGPGEDQGTGGDRQAFLPARCQPRLGVLTVACGATALAARVGDVMFLPTGLALPQVSPRVAVRPRTRSSMARRWLGRSPAPNRSTEAAPSRRQTSAPSGRRVLRPSQRSAMSALMVACTRSKVGAVRGVSRAVVLVLWWPSRAGMTRTDTPRSKRGVA
jgi:hypothetical protein